MPPPDERGSERMEGVVREQLPRALYRVELASHDQIVAHAAGAARRNFVRLLVGDRVEVMRSPRQRTRGRITSRLG